SAGSGVDLVVDGEKLAGFELGGVVAVVSIDDELSAFAQFAGYLRQLILREREDHRNRLQLSDHQKAVGVRGVDGVADVDEPQNDAATNWGRYMGINDLQLGAIDDPLVSLNGTFKLTDLGALGIDLLLGDDPFFI